MAKRYHKRSNTIFMIIVAAIICVLVIQLVLHMNGVRYNFGTNGIKFFGVVDKSDENKLLSGTLYFSDGTSAKVEEDGKLVFSNGNTYEGELKSYKFDGMGKLYMAETGDVYEGGFVAGVKEGTGKYTYANGDVYEGGFKNNKKDGEGVYTWADGSVFTGTLKEDLKDGENCTYTWADGSSYTGGYKNDKKHGENGKFVWASGAVYEGDFADDMRTGQGKYTWPNGETYTGGFKNNLLDGSGTYTWPSGRVYTGIFKEGKIVQPSDSTADDTDTTEPVQDTE